MVYDDFLWHTARVVNKLDPHLCVMRSIGKQIHATDKRRAVCKIRNLCHISVAVGHNELKGNLSC